MSSPLRRWILAGAISAALGCGGVAPCPPDTGASCECTVDEVRNCTTASGTAGLQVCERTRRWSACAPFGDGGGDPDAGGPRDVQLLDSSPTDF